MRPDTLTIAPAPPRAQYAEVHSTAVHSPEVHSPEVHRIAGGHLPDGRVVDVDIDHSIAPARVVAVSDSGATRAPGPAVVDATGHLLLTAPAEPHAHLDKAGSWDAVRSPVGDLGAAIDAWIRYAATADQADITKRATAAVWDAVRAGTTSIRTHVDLHATGEPLRGVRALAEVRDALRDVVHIEIVVLTRDEPTELIEAALDVGADLVGGAPHLSPDPVAETDRLVGIAERAGRGIDLHTDEYLSGAEGSLGHFARRVAAWPTDRTRTAGHCCALSTLPAARLSELTAELVAADVGVVALPITNLFLQGHGVEHSVPRGIAPVRRLLDAGVRVAGGADNVRDPFNPVGRADAFETAMLLVVGAHLGIDEAWHAVSDGARDVMGLPPAGPVVGAVADLLAVRAPTLEAAVASAPADRIVVHHGRLVSALATVAVDPIRTSTDVPSDANPKERP